MVSAGQSHQANADSCAAVLRLKRSLICFAGTPWTPDATGVHRNSFPSNDRDTPVRDRTAAALRTLSPPRENGKLPDRLHRPHTPLMRTIGSVMRRTRELRERRQGTGCDGLTALGLRGAGRQQSWCSQSVVPHLRVRAIAPATICMVTPTTHPTMIIQVQPMCGS